MHVTVCVMFTIVVAVGRSFLLLTYLRVVGSRLLTIGVAVVHSC
jgi:hypothetical protein